MKLAGDRNQCPSCGEYFNSTKAFDCHRTGRFGTPDDPRSARRCLNPEEMRARNMAVNQAGFWISGIMTGAVLEAKQSGARMAQEAITGTQNTGSPRLSV